MDIAAVYADADAVALDDVLNPWDRTRSPSGALYHDLVMAADAVLDVAAVRAACWPRAKVVVRVA